MLMKIKEFCNKYKKRIVTILILLIILSIGIVLFLYFKKPVSSKLPQDSTTKEETWIPESSNIESVEEEIIPKEWVEVEPELEGFVIEFFEKPQRVDKNFDFFKPIEGEGDVDELFKSVYITGKVKSGSIDGNDLAGYTSYLLNGYVRILHHDQKNITYFLSVSEYTKDVEYQAHPNVHMPRYTSFLHDAFIDPIFRIGNIVKSDKGRRYLVSRGCFPFLERTLEVVDTVNGHNIYIDPLSDEGLMFVMNKDGTYSSLRYEIPFGGKINMDDYYALTFRVNNSYDFTGLYSFYRFTYTSYMLSKCREGYIFRSPDSLNLEKVGTLRNGDPVYQEKDRKSVEDFYMEYKASSKNINNTINQDDDSPYTFEQFEKSFPVLYWLSPFGTFIRFERFDFVPDFPCYSRFRFY